MDMCQQPSKRHSLSLLQLFFQGLSTVKLGEAVEDEWYQYTNVMRTAQHCGLSFWPRLPRIFKRSQALMFRSLCPSPGTLCPSMNALVFRIKLFAMCTATDAQSTECVDADR